ncbi:hypothetical protein BOTCAL_1408g00010 [Botryotinia calthae]|uniref:Major facilitator superfamily (MFS) profile domain-containing protein n=1 Tax=Botryotinia calthae TaxID=38488 RepID=A0A4Y8CC46_9HELO|nr:hypothetical protein BOTCAL_1408g00010 [Botryotinia calthae]
MVEKLPRDAFADDIESGTIVTEGFDALSAPDGGFLAWVQCASSFFLFMGTWGIANSFGIGSSGAALGGIIFPIIFHHLQPRLGFGWTIRVIAFIMLLLFFLPVLGMKMRVRPSIARRVFEFRAWKELPFFLSGVFLFLAFFGTYIPSFYIQSYGEANSIAIGFYLVPILNAGSLFGRLIPPYIADYAGVFNTEIACVLLAGILAFVWISVHDTVGLIIYTIVYGFFAGALTGLSPNIAIALSPDIGLLGVRLGMLLIPIALGLLFGNPIAGAISSHGWMGLQLFTGGAVLLSTVVIVIVRVVMYGWSWKTKC